MLIEVQSNLVITNYLVLAKFVPITRLYYAVNDHLGSRYFFDIAES